MSVNFGLNLVHLLTKCKQLSNLSFTIFDELAFVVEASLKGSHPRVKSNCTLFHGVSCLLINENGNQEVVFSGRLIFDGCSTMAFVTR